jgi:hypothetical protein
VQNGPHCAGSIEVKERTQDDVDRLAAQAPMDVWHGQENARADSLTRQDCCSADRALGRAREIRCAPRPATDIDAALAELAVRTQARHAALRLPLDLHRLSELDG